MYERYVKRFEKVGSDSRGRKVGRFFIYVSRTDGGERS